MISTKEFLRKSESTKNISDPVMKEIQTRFLEVLEMMVNHDKWVMNNPPKVNHGRLSRIWNGQI